MVDKMEALAGIKFDDAYIAGMIKDHKMDAKEFKTEAAETKDAEIKTFVDRSISLVEEHLSQVTAMKKVPAAGVDPKL
jgi:putative membrane protein